MDKYLGNKKSIVENIEQLMIKKKIRAGIFFDAFTGTTNVAQYFKQRGFDIITSDSNSFSKVLSDAYIVNNSFPKFEKLIGKIDCSLETEKSLIIIEEMIDKTAQKIISDKIFQMDYLQVSDFVREIRPLAKVIYYLNCLSIEKPSEDQLFFYNYYSIYGENSIYTSQRGTKGKRNYFSKENAIKLGVILRQITDWFNDGLIENNELNILLTAVIEEVTLVANVAGTFHDFNREKLYPNALNSMKLRIPLLNISNRNGNYYSFKGDTNLLYKLEEYKTIVNENNEIEVLYIDPPYNFRQYSDYYHLLNFIAEYPWIPNLKIYGERLEYVRGQNMQHSFKSQYCYKDSFQDSLTELISNTPCKHVIISYYDENNHWSHGKKKVSYDGRDSVVAALENSIGINYFEKEPYSVKRLNYQSRKGENKKNIDELFFYGRKDL